MLPMLPTHFTNKDMPNLKVTGCKKIFQADGNQEQTLITVRRSNKTRKPGHYGMIKISIQEEGVFVVKVYVSNAK